MSKPLIPDHVWVDNLYESLKAEWPDEDEQKLRDFAEELITRAKNMGAQMKAKREALACQDDQEAL